MKFYDCPTAPSPRRIRIFLAEKGLKIETVQVDLGSGEQLSGGFAVINPNHTVPVLELDDGTRLLDSNSISIYLDEIFPEPNLTGRDSKERAVVAMWQREMDINGLMAVAECFRNSSKGLKGRALTGAVDYAQIPELADRGRQRVRHFFADLDRRLGQREYVAGDRFTVADITALVTIDFARAIKESLPPEAVNLRRWYTSVSSRPSIVS
jgi:glutathione S-transferase